MRASGYQPCGIKSGSSRLSPSASASSSYSFENQVSPLRSWSTSSGRSMNAWVVAKLSFTWGLPWFLQVTVENKHPAGVLPGVVLT